MPEPIAEACAPKDSRPGLAGLGNGYVPWFICSLLFLATVLNYLDRQTISVSASKIADEIGLNDADLGKIFFGFLFSYGISQLLVGTVLDRIPVRWTYAVAVSAWSLAGALTALAKGFWSLFFFRVLLGMCESPNWPLALRVVSRMFPPSQRSLATGIFQSGTSIGALIAPPVIIYLTLAYNWRMAFVVVGAVGFVWVALWLGWLSSRPQPRIDSDTPLQEQAGTGLARSGSPVASLAEILRSRTFWGLFIATTFLNPLQYFYTTWLPRYFEKYADVGFGKELAGRLVLVYLALDVGLWSGGVVVALLSRRFSVPGARLLVTVVGTLCMMSVPIISQTQRVDAITGVLCLATFGLGWFMVNYLAFTSEVSAQKVSTVAGLLGGAGSLSGAIFMLLVGHAVEETRSFALAFSMAGVMPIISLGGICLSTGPLRRHFTSKEP
ncbi:MAG: MFS transporter [Acidobacteria bacterium]|nr:MFS transporter [Acidobacteriota bacterium]MCI0722680.1 MFS transporter [Acidobacteriota bacterium]